MTRDVPIIPLRWLEPDPSGLVDGTYGMLGEDQLAALEILLEGRSLAIDAPGGTGKTALVSTYLARRMAAEPDCVVFAISLFPIAFDGTRVRAFGHERVPDLVADFHAVVGATPRVASILIVDEAAAIGDDGALDRLPFSQVVEVGDVRQTAFREPFGRRRLYDAAPPLVTLTEVTRGGAQDLDSVMSYFQSGWSAHGVPVPSGGTSSIRVRSCRMGPDGDEAGVLIARAVRHALASNLRLQVALIVDDPDRANALAFTAAVALGVKGAILSLDAVAAQGQEADVIVAALPDAWIGARSFFEVLSFVRMLWGRARRRLELVVPEGHDNLATRVASLLSLWRFEPEPGVGDPDLSSFERAATAVGLEVIRDDHGFILRRPGGSDPILLATSERVGGPERRRAAFLRSRGWQVRRVPACHLVNGVFDPEEAWFAELASDGRMTSL